MANTNKPVELDEAALNDASGGLPAVQKVREASQRLQANSARAADGSVNTSLTTGASSIADGTSNTILLGEKQL